MTTAYYRTEAADLEARCEWDRAAQAWQNAIAAFKPHAGSQLAQRDLGNMADRRDLCQTMAAA